MNTIIIYTITAMEAEHILKEAERCLRYHWNLYGFHRLGSGWDRIVTDGFGNPYGRERELRVFGIAIEVPSTMTISEAMVYVNYGQRVTAGFSEVYFTELD